MKRLNWKRALVGTLLAGFATITIAAEDLAPVHSPISAQPPKGCGSGFWSVHYDNAYKTLREAEDYKSGLRTYYVRELNDRRNEYLLAGISQNFRKDWLGSHHIQEKDTHCIVPLFDEIGAAAKRTLKTYRPAGYEFHEASDERLVKDAVKERIPDVQIMRTGVKQGGWEIENLGNGTPSLRYKYGMAWVKSSTFDDGFCRIVHVNIIQDYSGGGTYADSKSRYINMEPAGCE